MPDHEKGGRTVGTGPDEAGEMDMATMDNNTVFDNIVKMLLQLIQKDIVVGAVRGFYLIAIFINLFTHWWNIR